MAGAISPANRATFIQNIVDMVDTCGFDGVDGDPPVFVSYDEQTIEHKLEYVRDQNLGGAIVWEIGGGYLPATASGDRELLLQAVKQHRR